MSNTVYNLKRAYTLGLFFNLSRNFTFRRGYTQPDTAVSVVIGADLGDMFAYEVDQCGSHDIVACAINDCVEDAAEMWNCCQSNIKTLPASCFGSCLNITGIKKIFYDNYWYIVVHYFYFSTLSFVISKLFYSCLYHCAPCLKNVPHLAYYNFDAYEWILICLAEMLPIK